MGCDDNLGWKGKASKGTPTSKSRFQTEKEPALQIWEVCYGQRDQQAQWPRSAEPLTHFRNTPKASLAGAE